MWPFELCHRQWPWSTFKVITATFVWKRSLLLWSLTERRSHLTKDDIADDLEWPLNVWYGINGMISLYLKIQHIAHEINYTGPMSYVSNYVYCRIRMKMNEWNGMNEWKCYDVERDMLAIAKFFIGFTPLWRSSYGRLDLRWISSDA